mgnify:CR=1 FL=1
MLEETIQIAIVLYKLYHALLYNIMHYFIISCIKSMVVQQLDALFADLYGDPNAEDLRAAHVRNNRQEILL